MPSDFPPSVEEQLAAYRAATDLGVAMVHVDTCLGCFLTDHHNRNGEVLFGVSVDGTTTNADALNGLLDEMRQTADRVPEHLSWDIIKGAAKALFVDADPAKLFDASLEVTGDADDIDGGDYCQAWFVLTWDLSEGGDA